MMLGGTLGLAGDGRKRAVPAADRVWRGGEPGVVRWPGVIGVPVQGYGWGDRGVGIQSYARRRFPRTDRERSRDCGFSIGGPIGPETDRDKGKV